MTLHEIYYYVHFDCILFDDFRSEALPVRLYSDPDVNWFITERNTPIEWTNLADITSCIVQLSVLGNKNAEYIPCLTKGFKRGKRHPHGFSMLDADEFIVWVNKMLYAK